MGKWSSSSKTIVILHRRAKFNMLSSLLYLLPRPDRRQVHSPPPPLHDVDGRDSDRPRTLGRRPTPTVSVPLLPPTDQLLRWHRVPRVEGDDDVYVDASPSPPTSVIRCRRPPPLPLRHRPSSSLPTALRSVLLRGSVRRRRWDRPLLVYRHPRRRQPSSRSS